MCEDKINVRVKGELPRTAEAAQQEKTRQTRETQKSATLTLNCCSRCSVAELQSAARERERESAAEATT